MGPTSQGMFWLLRELQKKGVFNALYLPITVVPDMSVWYFFQAMVRFTNLYGIPSAGYSDNAFGIGQWKII